MTQPPQTSPLSSLEMLLKQKADGPGPAPVDAWNPPYCGDIGLAIKSDGTWLYQNSPIGRQALVKLFARVLRRDADGKHYLVTPVEKVDVRVDDAPFLAVEMHRQGEGREQVLTFRTNVDDVVELGHDHPVRFAASAHDSLKPYLRVRGRLEALVTRSLYYDLVALAEEDNDGRLSLWSGGARFIVEATR